jgi:hypothetical protein
MRRNSRYLKREEWEKLYRHMRIAYATNIMSEAGIDVRIRALDLFRNLTDTWSNPLYERYKPQYFTIPRIWRSDSGQIIRQRGIWATRTMTKFLKQMD